MVITVHAQTPTITMTTTMSINSQISFSIRGSSASTPIQIDWGNGVKENYTIGDSDEAFGFPVKGSTIKIWGSGVEGFNIQSKNLTTLTFSEATSLKTLFCKNNQLTTLNLSGCTALTLVECKQNLISSLTLPSTATLTYVDCSDNNLTLASLPIKQGSWTTYIYSPQKDYTLPKTIYAVNEEIDLNSQLTINGNTTIYTLKTASGTTLVNSIDYNIAGGKFTFLKTYPESLYCEMINATFPSLTLKTISFNIPPLPAVVMTTTTAVGSTFSFSIAANANNTPIQVDWGDGVLVNYTINIYSITPSSTLKGNTIKIFGEGISWLFVSSNNLTNLDISNNIALEYLSCYSNQLISLDVSKNTALTYLNCYSNQLTALDVTKNTALVDLDFSNNNLTTIDVSNCTLLKDLRLSSNQLTSLDISNNTALICLDFNYNKLSTIDILKNTLLKYLNFRSNQLIALDLSKNTALINLDISFNKITTIDLSNCISLKSLSCSVNQLSALDISKNIALTSLSCTSNHLNTLDVSKNTALTYIECSCNLLTALDVSNCILLDRLKCYINRLTTLDVSKNTALDNLDFSYNNITTIDVSNNTALTFLFCGYNKLTTLDLSSNTALINFDCKGNRLNNLDVTKNIAITNLGCSENLLTTLDVTKNTAMTKLECNSNKLTSLDLSKNTALTSLSCQSNLLNFTTLPIKQNTWVTYTYSPQAAFVLQKKNYTLSETIDLSSQLTINSNTTNYTLKTKSGSTLTSSVDYTATNGIFTFLKTQTDSVYCQMTNATFPDLTLSTTNVKITQFPSSVDENKMKVNIYPNPVKEFLNIEYDENITKVDVFTITGVRVFETIGSNTNTMTIPAINLPKGMLIVKIYSRNGIMEQKILKE